MGENNAKTQKNSALDNVQRATEIFLKHGVFIRAVIRHKVRNESIVEDLFQDFFLSLAAKPVPSDVQNIRSFLYKALINDITDRFRSIERYQNLTHNYANFHDESVNNQEVTDALIQKEQIEKIMELIGKRAAKRESEAIDLRFNEDLSIGEIAGRMDIDRHSVSRYISAGLRKVRQFLALEQGD